MNDNNPRMRADITPREWDAWEWSNVTRSDEIGPVYIRTKPRVEIAELLSSLVSGIIAMEPTKPKPPISDREFLLRQIGRIRSGKPQLIHEAQKAMEARLEKVK